MIEVRQLSADDWRDWRDLRLRALTDAPYAFGSTLADWQDADETRWRQRFTDVPYNAIALLDGEGCGMVGCLDLIGEPAVVSVWVAPSARGRGVGDALLAAAVDWAARAAPGVPVVLTVIDRNEPAIALYRRNGFVDDGPAETVGSDGSPERRMVRR